MNHRQFIPYVCLIFLLTGCDSSTSVEQTSTTPEASETTSSDSQPPEKAVVPDTTPDAGTPVANADLSGKGEDLYMQHCTTCHQKNGAGRPPAFPTLIGSASVKDDALLLERLLNGKPGTAMLGFKSRLDHEELAAVATFVRTSWGNQGNVVQSSDIVAYLEK